MVPAPPEVSRFLHGGRLETMPRRREHRLAVARWLAHAALPDLLEPVGERELTRRLGAVADDPVGVRRALVDLGIVHRTRDGAEYWRTELTEHDRLTEDDEPAGAAGTGGPHRTLHLDGGRVDSIAAFYVELDRVFMAGEDWRLGPSLDALDDLLHGGFGAAHGAGRLTVVWHGFARSREALGFAATREYYLAKLADPRFDSGLFRRRLADLEAGTGKTYAELVLEVFADHPEVQLVLR
ncbi:DUF2087 domain-containing protein [Isoptericola sp. 4D.3]|uniref:DUF2087 domain-containing protein n=1 Tax=Isoptericola peretonis TaxID=2918523 RepID=A0ABT0IZS5_9MICO|nr:DUF2087 domain-containing protein [Isoptericola sp. 4D.3]